MLRLNKKNDLVEKYLLSLYQREDRDYLQSNNHQTKEKRTQSTEAVAQLAVCLPSIQKALGCAPSTTKTGCVSAHP